MHLTRSILIALLVSSVTVVGSAQHAETPESETPVHYKIYDAEGNEAPFDALLERALSSDVVLVGEEHDDPIAHWLQAELLKNLLEKSGDRPVALSLEMFERDVQHVVDEFMDGLISESHFKKSGRAWSNYDTDYRPMVEAAMEAGIPVIAANAPRRYVNRVSREGAESLDDLSSRARSWLAPLPYEGASEDYSAQWNAMMAEQMAEMQAASERTAAADDAGDKECKCSENMSMHRMMHGADSSAGAGHGQMGAMHGAKAGAEHGTMVKRGDSAGGAAGMCANCMGMRGDSTSAGKHGQMGAEHGQMSAEHGKHMMRMMHSDSTSGASHSCPHCARQGMGGHKSSDGKAEAPAMPDDEVHRRVGEETEGDADEKPAMGAGADAAAMHGAMSGMLDAQSLWDATMAHSIARYLESEPKALVMHAVGSFHVDFRTGIPEQLPIYRPSVKQLVVSIRSAEDISSFDEENIGRGDFVILTDAALPRSYESRTD